MIHWIPDALSPFPDLKYTDENGIIAIGGQLSSPRLLMAYINGIFPWYNPGEPIIWHCPDPRFVLYPDELYISKSMHKVIKSKKFNVTFNTKFASVIEACRYTKRKGDDYPSWITNEMEEAYLKLHNEGYAHSIEVWQEEKLVGGLYGIVLGKIFYGESMFSLESNASKMGFIKCVEKLKSLGIVLIDCQQETNHLKSLGARVIPRDHFVETLRNYANFNPLVIQ